MTSDNIGDALLARRKQRRLDQGRAAAEIGVSPSTYRSYEKNTQRPSVNVFPSLAKFLGLEIEDFLPLYAATVIFALRPALEKELAGQGNLSDGEVSPSGEVERMVVTTPADIDPAPEDWTTNDSMTSDDENNVEVEDDEDDEVEDDEDDVEVEDDVEEEELADLSSSDEQFFSMTEEPATYQSFASEAVKAVPVVEDDLDDDAEDEDEDEDEEDEDEDEEFEVAEVMVVETDVHRSIAMPDVSQFTSIPSNFQKSSEKKKKKKKSKKR